MQHLIDLEVNVEHLIYEYFLAGLTLAFWLSPIILLAVVSVAHVVLKNAKVKKQKVQFSIKDPKGIPAQKVF